MSKRCLLLTCTLKGFQLELLSWSSISLDSAEESSALRFAELELELKLLKLVAVALGDLMATMATVRLTRIA